MGEHFGSSYNDSDLRFLSINLQLLKYVNNILPRKLKSNSNIKNKKTQESELMCIKWLIIENSIYKPTFFDNYADNLRKRLTNNCQMNYVNQNSNIKTGLQWPRK